MWRFEVFKDDGGGWRWRLVQRNTLIVVESSQSFDRRADAKHAAMTARLELGNAPIDEV